MNKLIAVLLTVVLFLIVVNTSASTSLEDGLVAYYPFDGNADDASGNGYHGTEHGGLSYVSGINGQAANFDGVDDFIDVGHNVTGNTALSISAWVRFDQLDTVQTIVGKYDGDSGAGDNIERTFDLLKHNLANNNEVQFTISEDGTNFEFSQSDSITTANEWYHIAATFGHNTIQTFINGTPTSNTPSEFSSLYASNIATVIGTNVNDSGYSNINMMKGDIDELRIYNRILSESEIEQLYNQTPSPQITSVLPLTGTINIPTTYTIQGTNLPDNLCTNIEGMQTHCTQLSGNSTEAQVSCTPEVAGNKRFYIKAECGGQEISGSEEIYISVAEEPSLDDGLVAYYPFDGNADDASGNGNHGTEYGEIDYVEGIVGNAGQFNGTQNIKTPIKLNGVPENQFITIALWGKADTKSVFITNYNFGDGSKSIVLTAERIGIIAGFSGYYSNGYCYKYNSISISKEVTDSTTCPEMKNYDLSDFGQDFIDYTNWHHYVLTYDNNVEKVYIDGELVAEVNIGANQVGGYNGADRYPRYDEDSGHSCHRACYDRGLNIGSYNNVFNYPQSKIDEVKLKGFLDEVRIYNRPLSESEIQALYNENQSPVVTSITPTTGTLSVATTYTITGNNLPETLVAQIEGMTTHCTKLTSSDTQVEVTCTPLVAGNQRFFIKDKPGSEGGVPINGSENLHVFITEVELPNITDLYVEESTDPNAIFTFSAVLTDNLPEGYAVFLNFDNQQGDWFLQTDEGGHMELPNQTDNTHWLNYTLVKPGLRSFRAGIFATQGDQDPSNDILIGNYSDKATCTLPACLAAVTRANGYGNPAVTGSGSQLFKNVDVANGNYHLSITDISVPGKGPAFAFSRAYNSLSEESKQWTFGYEMKATYLPDDIYNRQISIGPREDGHMQYFFKDMDQLWYALNPGNFDQLIENPDGSFVLYTKGNRLYLFANPTDGGQLQRIEDRLGNALTFNYTGDYLTNVTNTNGRNFTITRDANNRIHRVTDFTNRYVEYSYDSNGMITAVRNMRGDSHRYTYAGTTGNDRYRLASITDPRNNLQLSINYKSDGRVDDLTDGADNVTDFLYGTDNGKQVTGIEQPRVDGLNHNIAFILDDNRTRVEERLDAQNYGDYRTKQSYQQINNRTRLAEQGLVTRIVDPKEQDTDIEYSQDGKGNPETITDAAERETKATYKEDDTGNQTNLTPITSVKQPGVATPTSYDEFTTTGKAKKIVDPRGYDTLRQFDGNDWMTQTTNAREFTTQYEYGAYGNITKIIDANEFVTNRDYDELGRLETEISPLGLTTSYTYDEHGNVLSRTEQATGGIDYTTEYGYDASDNLSWTIDPRDNRTDYVYDNLNRKIDEQYSVGGVQHTRRYAYDAMGRLESVTNERNQTTQTHYTVRSKVKHKINPLNETTVRYTYDKNGNIETVTDGEDRTITYKYDALNRKESVKDEEDNEQKWTYNTAGQVATYQDSRDKITHYEYDAGGNLTKLTDPKGGITRSTYDGNGNILEVIDPKNHKTTYTYDALDRRKTTTLHNGEQWKYDYDANGNLLKETTPNGEYTEQVYDALNRVTQLTEYAADNSITRQISYTYDANNNVLSKTSGGNTISYTYDELNRISSITDQNGQTVGYSYDGVGNLTTLTYPGNKTVSYEYDLADQLNSVTDWLNQTTSYTRNKSGQPTMVNLGNGTQTEYEYEDTTGRLKLLKNLKAGGEIISSHDMTLDEAGNITAMTADLPLLPSFPANSGSLSYDNNNRLLQAGTTSYTHDLSGRIVEEDKNGVQTVYHLNVNDLITDIVHDGNTQVSYAYDQNNNRIRQVQNSTETRYILDQNQGLTKVLAETDENGQVQHYYIYGDALLSQIDPDGSSHFYHYDPTGHTLALTDENGEISDRYAYTPYGHTTKQGTTHNPFLYVGRYGVMDDGNGLHYMRARYYKEEIGRFMSLDALMGEVTEPQSLNRYAYALGNPVMGVDPSGMSCEMTSGGSFSDGSQCNNHSEGVTQASPGVNTNQLKFGVNVASSVIERYMKGARDTYVSFKVEGGFMKYNLFRYKPQTQALVKNSVQLLAAGIFTSIETYEGCKDDITSTKCAFTIAKILNGTIVGGAAGIVCIPGGPFGVLLCHTVASSLSNAALDEVYNGANDLFTFAGEQVNKAKMNVKEINAKIEKSKKINIKKWLWRAINHIKYNIGSF